MPLRPVPAFSLSQLFAFLATHRAATNAQMPTLSPKYDPAKAKQTGSKSSD